MRTERHSHPTRLSCVVASAAVFAGGCSSLTAALTEPPPSFPSLVRVQEPVSRPATREALRIASFDRPGHVTNLGTAFGAWDSDPGDPTQFCRVRLVDATRMGLEGFVLMLEYDVESPNPAYNGFWMKLPAVPLERYDALSLAVKGDAERGFTRRLRVELKDRSHVARVELDGIEADWKRVRLPLREFDGIGSVRNATEFVIVFEEEIVTEKVGTLYLDDVAFEPAP